MPSNQLDYKNLYSLAEWQFLADHLRRMMGEYCEDVLECSARGEINQMLDYAGRIRMIKEVLTLPEFLFAPGRDKNATNS